MKRLFTFLFFGLAIIPAGAQTGTWIWVNGSSSTSGDSGTFGTQGVAAASNCPPSFYQAVQWMDKQGNLWIFGGSDYSVSPTGNFSDLWKYDPVANMWTWVKGPGIPNQPGVYGTLGIPAPSNQPGGRAYGCNTWADSSGDLWLFGGAAYDAVGNPGRCNDLWRYNIASNEWTWMAGSKYSFSVGHFDSLYHTTATAEPPARAECNTNWTDAGNNLWLFGGVSDSNRNDIWRFSVALNEWAWMGGGRYYTPGSYGIKGVESPSNLPAPRYSNLHWINGNYLYTAAGFDGENYYNDVWRFNLTNNQWTWIGGDSGNLYYGNYNSYCTITGNNNPSGLIEARSTQINVGCTPLLLVYGGKGPGLATNNLWRYDLNSGNWIWLTGDSTTGFYGNFGTKGLAAPGNMPPELAGVCLWADSHNNVWLWGGAGDGVRQSNAMWKYIPDTACFPVDTTHGAISYRLSKSNLCGGDSTVLTLSGATGYNILPNNSVHWRDSAVAVIQPDTTATYMVSGYSPCGSLDTASFTVQVLNVAVHISSNKNNICPNDSAQICAPAGYSSYLWNTGATTNCITANQAGNYYVTVSESGCSATSNHFGLSVYAVSSLAITQSGDTLKAYNSTSYQWYLNGTAIPGADNSIYIATEPGSYSLQVTDSNGCIAVSNPQIISGINDVEAGSISVYPNPSNSSWQLNVTPQLTGSTAEVFDVTGKLVFKSQINNQQSKINIPEASKGIYLLRINSENFVATKKLEKM